MNYSQLELFPQSGDSGAAGNVRARGSFLRCIWNYERTILVIIALIITGIISFSFGVEKGKKLIVLGASEPAPKQIINQPSIRIQPLVRDDAFSVRKTQNPPVIEKQETSKTPKAKEFIENYTVQVASYQGRDYAAREITLLKGKGYSPVLLSKKGYVIICVGSFASPVAAKSLVSELKKQYRDCFVKKL